MRLPSPAVDARALLAAAISMGEIDMRGRLPPWLTACWVLHKQSSILRRLESIQPDALEHIDADSYAALLRAFTYALKATDRLLVHTHRPWARARMKAHLQRFVAARRNLVRYQPMPSAARSGEHDPTAAE